MSQLVRKLCPSNDDLNFTGSERTVNLLSNFDSTLCDEFTISQCTAIHPHGSVLAFVAGVKYVAALSQEWYRQRLLI
jgi:hypothetical protein